MSRRDNDTFRTVEGRYESWNEANPRPRSRSAIVMPEVSEGVEKLIGTALGFGTAALLLLLAAVALYAASTWGAIERSGALVAYTITGFFLLLAGIGGLAATWNHLFRVMPGEASHH